MAYCWCRNGYNNQQMIKCDVHNGWVHRKCEKLDNKTWNKLSNSNKQFALFGKC